MASSKKETRVSLENISESLQKGLSGVDPERKTALEGLMRMRSVKGSRLEREKSRLANKLGEDHPRVKTLNDKIEVNRGMMRDIAVGIEHAGTEVPRVDDNTWILHGFVRNKSLQGIPNLTVALYDQDGRRVEQLGYACTDKTGYFKITFSRGAGGDRPTTSERPTIISDRPTVGVGTDKPGQGPQAFIRVLDEKGVQLYVDKQLLTLELGRVEYREIILDDERERCTPPADFTRPRPEPTPEPKTTEAFRLEDIKGIGNERARRLRDAGIRDLKTFLETDDARLKEIMGGVNVAGMKKEAASLLQTMK